MPRYQGNLNEPNPEKIPPSVVATRGPSGSIANGYHKKKKKGAERQPERSIKG